MAAPAKLIPVGLCPVRSHNKGRMITGDVADKVAMIPVLDPCKANKNKVIPINSPITAVAAVNPTTSFDTSRGRAGAHGIATSTPINNPDAPTLINEASQGSKPATITGRAIKDPAA